MNKSASQQKIEFKIKQKFQVILCFEWLITKILLQKL